MHDPALMSVSADRTRSGCAFIRIDSGLIKTAKAAYSVAMRLCTTSIAAPWTQIEYYGIAPGSQQESIRFI